MSKSALPDAWPRLMRRAMAAMYLGMSETKFDTLVREGRIAKPSREDGLVRWHRIHLDAYADALLDDAGGDEGGADYFEGVGV